MIKVLKQILNENTILRVSSMEKWTTGIYYFDIEYGRSNLKIELRFNNYNVPVNKEQEFIDYIYSEKERLDNYLLDNSSTDNKAFFNMGSYVS